MMGNSENFKIGLELIFKRNDDPDPSKDLIFMKDFETATDIYVDYIYYN